MDKWVRISSNSVIGVNPSEDGKRYYLDQSGIVVIPSPEPAFRVNRMVK